jgi:hypothetical protein
MPDNVVEIKIAATGVSEAGAQFEGFSAEVAAALKQISATAGVTAGDLNILQAVMKAEQQAGIELSKTLADVAASNGAFSKALRDAASSAAEAIPPVTATAAAAQQTASSAVQASTALMVLAPALTQVAAAAGGAGGGLAVVAANAGAAGAGASGAGNAASGASVGFFRLYTVISLLRRALADVDEFRKSEEELKHLADATGVSAERIAEFEGAVNLAGGDGDKFGGVINRLARSMETAQQGSAKMQDDLRRLGVTAKDPIAAFYQMADTIHNTSDKFEALGIAEQITGRSSVDLIGIFNEGAAALGKNAAASAELARSRMEAISSADELTVAEVQLKAALQEVLAGALPQITAAIKALAAAFEILILPVKVAADTLIYGALAAADALSGDFSAAVSALHQGVIEVGKDAKQTKEFLDSLAAGPATVAPGAGKPFAKSHLKPDNNHVAEAEEQAEIAHNNKMAEIDAAGVEKALTMTRGMDEAVIEGMADKHDRAIAMAQDEVDLAERSQALLSGIDRRTLADNLALLDKKRALAAADPKNSVAEVAKVDAQIQALRDQSALKEVELADKVAKAKATLAKVTATQEREAVEEHIRIEEEGLTKLFAFQDAQARKTAEAAKKHAEAVMATDRTVEEGRLRHAAAMAQIDDEAAQARLERGEITKNEYLRIKQEEIDKAYQMELAAIKKERELLALETTDPDELAKGNAKLDNQQQAATDKHATASGANKNQQIATEMKEIKGVVDALSADIDKNVNKWITGQETFAKAVQGAWRDIESSAVSTIEHIIERQIEQFILNKALAAAGLATQQTVNAATKLGAAKTAAANTYASVSAIPYVGWILAPAAAAAAFVAVEAFETGGDVGGDGLAFLHANEHVINAPLTQKLQQVADSGGGAAASTASGPTPVTIVGINIANSSSGLFGNLFGSDDSKALPVRIVATSALSTGAVTGFHLPGISAAGGADLPNHNTLGFLHPREMVLPQSHADVIRGLAANGGARSSSSNVNVGSVNYRGAQLSDKHFGAMVKRLQRNANQ